MANNPNQAVQPERPHPDPLRMAPGAIAKVGPSLTQTVAPNLGASSEICSDGLGPDKAKMADFCRFVDAFGMFRGEQMVRRVIYNSKQGFDSKINSISLRTM
ncbi:MAG: hypothetical protein WDN24_04980 [Sphingomonas sp.]